MWGKTQAPHTEVHMMYNLSADRFVKSYTREAGIVAVYKAEVQPTSKSYFLTSGRLSNSLSSLFKRKQELLNSPNDLNPTL